LQQGVGVPCRDLGEADGPLLVFGGPYGNLQALEALIAAAGRHGVPPARCLCTGDVVAYCADAEATTARLAAWDCPTVMGNCEESVAQGAAECGCGFAEGSDCDLASRTWYAHAMAELSPASVAWMAALPRRIDLRLGGRRLAAVHGAVSAVNRFVFPSTPAVEKAAELDLAGVDGILCGHSGLPFAETVGGRLWLNAGVIGVPANDGTPRVWYALLEPEADGIRCSFHALAHDGRAAAAAIRAKRLVEGYARNLESGLWPSLDILPEAERRLTGTPLAPRPLFWPAAGRAAA